MALPANFDTVTVKGTYIDFTGQPVSGTISFVPTASHIKHLESDTIILAAKVDVEVMPDGTFSVVLPITGDPDVIPNFQYSVSELIKNVRRNYNIEIPLSMAGTTVDLSDLVPVGSVPSGTTALTRAVADTIYAFKGEGGGGEGGGESPVLQVADGYIQWKYPSDPTWTNLVALSTLEGADGTDGTGIDSVVDNGNGTMTIFLTDGTSSVIALPAGGGSGDGTVTQVAGVAPDVTGNVPLTKYDLELGNVDNTSDALKPISEETQAALNDKQDVLTAVRTTGDQTIQGVKTFSSPPVVPADSFSIGDIAGLQAALDGKLDDIQISVDPVSTVGLPEGTLIARTS